MINSWDEPLAPLVITEDRFPGGVLCSCGRELGEGDRYSKRITGVASGGSPVITIVCVPCGYALGSEIV
jgi:hypothetical protein